MKLMGNKKEQLKQLNNLKNNLKNKEVKHYKGGKYKILDVTIHQDSFNENADETLVVYYVDMSGNSYTRPLSEFFDKILFSNGELVDRFTYEELECN